MREVIRVPEDAKKEDYCFSVRENDAIEDYCLEISIGNTNKIMYISPEDAIKLAKAIYANEADKVLTEE